MRSRRFLTILLISLVAVLLLNALAGSASSPLEKALHIRHVPVWLPLALAAAVGLALGPLLNRPQPGAAAPSPRAGRPAAAPPTRGRQAVPRALRRQQERAARRRATPASRRPPRPSANLAPRGQRRRAAAPGVSGSPRGATAPPPGEPPTGLPPPPAGAAESPDGAPTAP